MLWIEAIGWGAALLTMSAYSMRTMLPLRLVAIFANLSFATYGYLTEIYPTLVLHLALFPFNCFRLYQILNDTRQMKRVRAGAGNPFENLGALLKTRNLEAGDYVFRKGDTVDHLYYLRSGRIALEGIDVTLTTGEMFGEIAFFTDEKQRTLSAKCIEPCEVAYIDEATFLKLYYQDPSFGLELMKLTTRRLVDGMHRRPEACTPQTS